MLPALRDEAVPSRARPAAPQAGEDPHGEGPGPAGREGLAEEEGGEGKVDLLAEVGRIKKGGQRSCPKDGRGADDGSQALLRHADVLLRQTPERGESAQTAA